jgi:hypothetical protein
VVEGEYTAVPRHAFAVSADLLMAALTGGGRERVSADMRFSP